MMELSDPILSGMRVLLVEDEALVAMLIEAMLEDLGCSIAGRAASSAEALSVLASGGVDAAVLDVNLGAERSTAVAHALVELKIPFVFSTGYGLAGVEPHLRAQPVLQKPFKSEDLAQALARARRLV
jgi:CheY-like chemotaxis protein